MEKRLFNLKNTRKTSINNKQPFSTVRSKYFPSKISNLSVSFSSVTQMHWKPLTCWITALHPHVFRLFWFASSPRTSVQTHFQKKKGKKKEYPRRQSLSGNHNKCNVCLWNTHESFISAPGHESHTTASLWWISSLAFTLSASTRLPFIPSKCRPDRGKGRAPLIPEIWKVCTPFIRHNADTLLFYFSLPRSLDS